MTSLLAVSLSAAFGLGALPTEVVVHAGKTDRVQTPVFVSAPKAETGLFTVHLEGIGPQPAQSFRSGDETLIWWIEPSLAAGKTRNVRIEKSAPRQSSSFHWSSPDGEQTTLSFGDRPVLRYEYRLVDPSDPEGIRKPYHHVFDPNGSQLITKGTGGLYTHHRGIFFGYNKCLFDGKFYDWWHCVKKKAFQAHDDFVATDEGPVFGGHTVRINWNDFDGKPVIEERRTLIAYRQGADRALIEFRSTLTALRGPVRLAGDRQHAGVHFRAAAPVADRQKETRYLRPEKWSTLPADKEQNGADHRDLPWNALRYSLDGRDYCVAYLSDPKNPDGADFSERLYGRFGEYFPYTLTKEAPLNLRYRFWIVAGATPSREDIDARLEDLAQPPLVTIVK